MAQEKLNEGLLEAIESTEYEESINKINKEPLSGCTRYWHITENSYFRSNHMRAEATYKAKKIFEKAKKEFNKINKALDRTEIHKIKDKNIKETLKPNVNVKNRNRKTAFELFLNKFSKIPFHSVPKYNSHSLNCCEFTKKQMEYIEDYNKEFYKYTKKFLQLGADPNTIFNSEIRERHYNKILKLATNFAKKNNKAIKWPSQYLHSLESSKLKLNTALDYIATQIKENKELKENPVNEKDGNGKTIFYLKCAKDKYLLNLGNCLTGYDTDHDMSILIKRFVKAGANINEKDSNGKTALHYAVINENYYSFAALLQAGADTKIQDNNGKTSLHYAAEHSDHDLLKTLLQAGADPNIQDKYGKTALHYAAKRYNDPNLLKFLLQAGADTKIQDNNGKTSLHYAAEHSDHDLLKTLLQAGADPNIQDKYGKTALHYAAEQNMDASLITLIEHKADIEAKDNNNITPITCSLTKKNYSTTFELILKHNPSLEFIDEKNNNVAHHAVILKSVSTKSFEKLHQRNVKFDQTNSDGLTPLMLACTLKRNENIEYLSKFAWAIKPNENNQTAYSCVQDLTALKTLHNNKLKPNKEDGEYLVRFFTGIIFRESNTEKSKEFFKEFFKRFKDIIVDNNLNNVLHKATSEGKENIVKFILKNNLVDVNAVNQDGKTACKIAKENGFNTIKEIIQEQGGKLEIEQQYRFVEGNEGQDEEIKAPDNTNQHNIYEHQEEGAPSLANQLSTSPDAPTQDPDKTLSPIIAPLQQESTLKGQQAAKLAAVLSKAQAEIKSLKKELSKQNDDITYGEQPGMVKLPDIPSNNNQQQQTQEQQGEAEPELFSPSLEMEEAISISPRKKVVIEKSQTANEGIIEKASSRTI